MGDLTGMTSFGRPSFNGFRASFGVLRIRKSSSELKESSTTIANLTFDSRLKSYLNNLHLINHRNLYRVLEQIVSKAIPLWNTSLSAVQSVVPRRIELKGDFLDHSGLTEDQRHWHYGDGDGDDPRPILQPDPGKFEYSEFLKAKLPLETGDDVDLESGRDVDLRAQHGNLQIILKLAIIHLTPEKPTYNGGSWHLEGQLNENMLV